MEQSGALSWHNEHPLDGTYDHAPAVVQMEAIGLALQVYRADTADLMRQAFCMDTELMGHIKKLAEDINGFNKREER